MKTFILLAALVALSGCAQLQQQARERQAAADRLERIQTDRLATIPRSDQIECAMQGQQADAMTQDPRALLNLEAAANGARVRQACLDARYARAHGN
ncbi:MAG TPA: hypothetical protein DDZ81_11080 [Acetobacteraceae bacterium]|jgi:hypothetical protein|nr:hypothetical protein [Acetobacteraceae bacterium]